jgi:hypothetical protein
LCIYGEPAFTTLGGSSLMILFFSVSAGRLLMLNTESGKLFQSNGFSVNGFGNGFAPPMLNGLEGILSSEIS